MTRIFCRASVGNIFLLRLTLPDCDTAKDDVQEMVIDVPGFGKVRFSFRRKTAKQGKNRFDFWAAVNAMG